MKKNDNKPLNPVIEELNLKLAKPKVTYHSQNLSQTPAKEKEIDATPDWTLQTNSLSKPQSQITLEGASRQLATVLQTSSSLVGRQFKQKPTLPPKPAQKSAVQQENYQVSNQLPTRGPEPAQSSQLPPHPFLPATHDEAIDMIRSQVQYVDSLVADNQALVNALDTVMNLKPTAHELHGILLNALWLKTTLGLHKIDSNIADLDPLMLQTRLLRSYPGVSFATHADYQDELTRRLLIGIKQLELFTSENDYTQNNTLSIQDKFILSHCKAFLAAYINEGIAWQHNEALTRAKHKLVGFAIQALDGYLQQRHQHTDIFSYASIILSNVAIENNRLEAIKGNSKAAKRLSLVKLPASFEEYCENGFQYAQEISEQEILELANTHQSELHATHNEQLALGITSLHDLLIQPNESEVSIYFGRLAIALNKALGFLARTQKIFKQAVAASNPLAKYLQQHFHEAFNKEGNPAINLSTVFNSADVQLLSGEIVHYLKSTQQNVMGNLLQTAQAKNVVILQQQCEAYQNNQMLGPYLFTYFDHWLRAIYCMTLRQLVDRQGHLLPAIKQAIAKPNEKNLPDIYLQLGEQQAEIGEKRLIESLHTSLLTKVFEFMLKEFSPAKPSLGSVSPLLLKLFQQRIHQKGLMLYPFLAEMKTIFTHFYFLYQDTERMQIKCQAILQATDRLMASKTKPDSDEVKRLISQAAEFIEKLCVSDNAPIAKQFVLEIKPLLSYWLDCLPAFTNDSFFVCYVPNMAGDFVKMYRDYFGNEQINQAVAQQTFFHTLTTFGGLKKESSHVSDEQRKPHALRVSLEIDRQKGHTRDSASLDFSEQSSGSVLDILAQQGHYINETPPSTPQKTQQ